MDLPYSLDFCQCLFKRFKFIMIFENDVQWKPISSWEVRYNCIVKGYSNEAFLSVGLSVSQSQLWLKNSSDDFTNLLYKGRAHNIVREVMVILKEKCCLQELQFLFFQDILFPFAPGIFKNCLCLSRAMFYSLPSGKV